MRSAFADMAEGHVEISSVGHVSGSEGAFHIKAAGRTIAPAFAVVKVNGNFPQNGGRHQLPTIQGFMALLDAECGCVLALMDSIEITARRTAAATALAAQYLADPDACTVGIVGCGVQARYHVVTLTTSTRPILQLADVGPGTFVAGVGADNPLKHELAPDLLRASHVVVDSVLQAATLGDLHHAIVGGEMIVEDVYGELADLVVGRVAPRSERGERWVFDSTGLAIQDLAAAEMMYELAQADPTVPRLQFND